MLPSLSDNERRLLLHVALMVSCGALVLLPLAGESSSEVGADAASVSAGVNVPVQRDIPRFPEIAIARDPFVADASEARFSSGDTSFDDGKASMVLPPNEGAFNSTPPGSDGAGNPLIRAIILGAQSKALIDIAGQVHVLGVGDKLVGYTVTAIDAQGLTLSNGARIAFTDRLP